MSCSVTTDLIVSVAAVVVATVAVVPVDMVFAVVPVDIVVAAVPIFLSVDAAVDVKVVVVAC